MYCTVDWCIVLLGNVILLYICTVYYFKALVYQFCICEYRCCICVQYVDCCIALVGSVVSVYLIVVYMYRDYCMALQYQCCVVVIALLYMCTVHILLHGFAIPVSYCVTSLLHICTVCGCIAFLHQFCSGVYHICISIPYIAAWLCYVSIVLVYMIAVYLTG
jgi:hypothetical protein